LNRFRPQGPQEIKVAKFTDTFGTVDGVSKTLDEQLCEAVRTGKEYTIISCVGTNNRKGLKVFEPVGMIDAPHFEQQKLCWPPVLKMLDYCFEERFTHIQAATPGPVGMAGMIVAKTLGLPFQAVYHTQIPEFVAKATDDPFLEGLAWKYCLWFYDTADVIFAPSEHTQNDLIEHGIRPEKIKTYPRGVDTRLFNPSRRTTYWEQKWNIEPGTVKALYVGRVSWEKNLPLLARAFKKAVDRLRESANLNGDSKISLLVVGEGGYWEEMKQECRGYPVILTGSLQGEELAQAFASADFFVFPSTTDTYGRVVVESMSSGIPCIVTNVGGPMENVTDDVNGMVVPGDDETALVEALLKMAFKVDRSAMAQRARESVETKSFAETFDRYWALYGQ
jgi:glycosyltransferase involved in cell wall biosynthesis